MQQPAPGSLRDALRLPREVVLGRTAAACVHPITAWRVLPVSWRILVFSVYTVASYLTVLSLLVILLP
jgi:hypothetical protein